MSQTSIQSYFPTRKRPANDEARGKNKVLILDQNQTRTAVHKIYPANTQSPSNLASVPEEKVLKSEKHAPVSHAPKLHTVVRNIQFDSPKGKSPQTRKPRTRKVSVEEGQADIRETFQKQAGAEEAKLVPFEKRGSLTPRKSGKKEATGTPKESVQTPKKCEPMETNVEINVNPSTPKKASDVPSLVVQKDMTLGQMKEKLLKSKRLSELRARINKIGQLDKKLEDVQKKAEKKEEAVPADKPFVKEFDSIELEIPVSPQKTMHSQMMSPTKTMRSPTFVSPSKIMTPKKAAPSPLKVTPTKEPAYKRFADLVSKEEFALPEHYRLLGELFRCIDTLSAMLFNRGETITFTKLKPSVQEMLRRNLNLDHLAQIKSLFPTAYEFEYKKYHKFATARNQDSYELIITPCLEKKAEDASDSKLSFDPETLLQRRRKMYALLLDKVMDEHEEYLKSVGMEIKRKELTRWHPAFDVNSCKPIKKAEMPSPPDTGNMRSAAETLEKAKQMFNCNNRMEKALEMLAESETKPSSEGDAGNSSVVDTPPNTPKAESQMTKSMLKGIPKSLLEKVRAKQAAKALEEMTRPKYADKEISMYAQLPSMAQVLRNVFVTEKKNVLALEFVIAKLEKSFRTKMSAEDFEKHLRLMSTLLPTWITILLVRKITYIKLLKNVELSTITERLDLCAKEKMKSYQTRS